MSKKSAPIVALSLFIVLCIMLVSCDITIPTGGNNRNDPGTGSGSGSGSGNNQNGTGSNSNSGGTGAGTSCYNPAWDRDFSQAHYVIHAIGHGTTDGPVTDDWWFLFGVEPKNNSVDLPDGSGGTFTYSTDYSSGPYNTPRAVCNAEGSRLGDRTMSAWQAWTSWNCKELLACNERAADQNTGGQNGQGNQGAGNQGAGNQGAGNQGAGNQASALYAWLDCGDFLDLEQEQVSEPCNVCVSGWESNTANRVTVTIQPVGNIIVSPGDTSADPGGMFNTGTTDHPEYCFKELWRTEDPTPRQVVVPITVSQGGSAGIPLTLTINVPEIFDGYPFRVCPATRTVTLTPPIFNWNRDWVDNYQVNLDGVADTFFNVTVTTSDPAAVITYIRLELTDLAGNPLGADYPIWDTMPNSYRYMAIYDPGLNQWLNGEDGSITVAMTGGSVTLTLDINDPESYLTNPNVKAMVTVEFGNNLDCTATGLAP